MTEKIRNNNVKFIVITGIIAAIYVVTTLMIAPISYGEIQFRLSEMLILLVFIDKKYSAGLILGCAIANFFSPLGIIDVFFGTMGTICSAFAISKTKNLFIATLWPTFFCIWVGFELSIFTNMPFFLTTLTVMIGEFTVVTIIGYPVFKKIMSNVYITKILKI